jgi:hypothetical protein
LEKSSSISLFPDAPTTPVSYILQF